MIKLKKKSKVNYCVDLIQFQSKPALFTKEMYITKLFPPLSA